MKKFAQSLTAITLALLLMFSLAACGSKKAVESSTESAVNEEQEVNDTNETKKETKKETKANAKSKIDTSIPVLEAGTVNTIDAVCDFTLDFVNITNDVLPPSPSSYYSHYEAEDGKLYADICISYKNLETANVEADDVISGKLFYGEYYEYTGFSIIEEDNRGDFTYSNITEISPLSTEYLHYLFEIPEEAKDSEYSLVAEIVIKDEKYTVNVKPGDKFTDVAPVATKTSGELALDELVTTDNGTFYVEYTNITNDVIPPSPDSYYSHYEADSGKVYVDICIAYNNLTDKAVDADEVLSGKVKYADIYEYTGFSMIEEEGRSDFTYSNITQIAPLSTEYLHYLFEVPEEVSTSEDSIVINLTVDDNRYTYTVR